MSTIWGNKGGRFTNKNVEDIMSADSHFSLSNPEILSHFSVRPSTAVCHTRSFPQFFEPFKVCPNFCKPAPLSCNFRRIDNRISDQPTTSSAKTYPTVTTNLTTNQADTAIKVLIRILRASLRANSRADGGSSGLAGKAPVR